LRHYTQDNGWTGLNSNTKFRGFYLGEWVYRRRKAFARGTLPEWLQVELEKIPGWTWTRLKTVELTKKEKLAIEALRRFVEQRGWRTFRSRTVFDGSHIGQFVNRWRSLYHRDELSKRHQELLESVPGWSWSSLYRDEHHRWMLAILRDYIAKHGWRGLKREMRVQGVNLGVWCLGRRTDFRRGKLAGWLRLELEAIPGWRWSGRMGVASKW
jgi:hypothetical protein